MGTRAVVPVGKGTRFGEFIIDAIIVGFVGGIIQYALASVMGSLGGTLAYPISIGLQFAYYYFQEKGTGQTLGKKILGTKAVMLDGSPVTDEAVLKRSLWRLLNIIFLIDAITFLIGERGLHDSQSDTTVISVK